MESRTASLAKNNNLLTFMGKNVENNKSEGIEDLNKSI